MAKALERAGVRNAEALLNAELVEYEKQSVRPKGGWGKQSDWWNNSVVGSALRKANVSFKKVAAGVPVADLPGMVKDEKWPLVVDYFERCDDRYNRHAVTALPTVVLGKNSIRHGPPADVALIVDGDSDVYPVHDVASHMRQICTVWRVCAIPTTFPFIPESIVNQRGQRVLIRWKGYPAQYDTWEPLTTDFKHLPVCTKRKRKSTTTDGV